MPFRTVYDRDTHFKRHGAEFGAATEVEYEAMADRFMFGPMNADTRDCTRASRDSYLRMDLARTDFGVTCVNRVFLRTFYRPTAAKIRNRGGAEAFLASECAR